MHSVIEKLVSIITNFSILVSLLVYYIGYPATSIVILLGNMCIVHYIKVFACRGINIRNDSEVSTKNY